MAVTTVITQPKVISKIACGSLVGAAIDLGNISRITMNRIGPLAVNCPCKPTVRDLHQTNSGRTTSVHAAVIFQVTIGNQNVILAAI